MFENQTVLKFQGNSLTRQEILFDEKIWCCKNETTYLTGLDQCVPSFLSNLYNESFPNYSFEDPNDGLTDCPDEYVSYSTEDFKLDNDNLFVGKKRLESNEFCINRVEEGYYSTSPGKFVDRYCVPDPCSESDASGSVALPIWPSSRNVITICLQFKYANHILYRLICHFCQGIMEVITLGII
jgi:hypothetical protein